MQYLDVWEEGDQLSKADYTRRRNLKYQNLKYVVEEIKWRQRLRCKCLKERDKNRNFFHGLATSRNRTNRILVLYDGATWFEACKEIIDCVSGYFKLLYSKEDWASPTLDNLEFNHIDDWVSVHVGKNFKRRKWKMQFLLWALIELLVIWISYGFLPNFCEETKKDVIAFMQKFHSRG